MLESESIHAASLSIMPSKRTRSSTQERKLKPSIAIIGAGRLGTAFGIALTRAGFRVPLVVSLNATHARRSAKMIGRRTDGASLRELLAGAKIADDPLSQVDLLLIAISDDAIETVAEQLARALRDRNLDSPRRRQIAMHTSGALGSEVLDSLRRTGFAVGSIHPLISISDPETGADWLPRAFFSLEGDPTAISLGKQIVRDLGGHSFQIGAETKALYHAAALMASPNMTALFDIALEMLSRCGLSRTRGRQVLLPLVESTFENLKTQDPVKALTGTFKRGDVATAAKHIAAINAAQLADALDAYLVLARRSSSLTKQSDSSKKMDRLLTRAGRRR